MSHTVSLVFIVIENKGLWKNYDRNDPGTHVPGKITVTFLPCNLVPGCRICVMSYET